MKKVLFALATSALVLSLGSRVLAEGNTDDPYILLPEYDYGKSRATLSMIERDVRQTPAEQYGAIESKLLPVLKSTTATFAAKQFVCHLLWRIGSAQCVPVLESFLADTNVADIARCALERLPCPQAGAALRRGLEAAKGDLQAGIINSLAARRDQDAVKDVSRFTAAPEPTIARAAIGALGAIGGRQAAKSLASLNVSESLAGVWYDACLVCAENLLKEDEAGAAAGLYRSLYEKNRPAVVRAAALRGLVRADGTGAAQMVIEALLADDAKLRNAAATAVKDIAGQDVVKKVVALLPQLPPNTLFVVLGALASRTDAGAAADDVGRLVTHEDVTVRTAAVQALAKLGNVGSVPILAGVLGSGDDISKTAAKALVRLSAMGVPEAILKQAEQGDPATRACLIGVLMERREKRAVALCMTAAEDPDAAVRQVAFKALAAIADPEDVSQLVELIVKIGDSDSRTRLEQTVFAAASRSPAVNARARPVIQALSTTNAAAAVSLLGVLKRLGGDEALRAIKPLVSSAMPDVRKAALQALADWPDTKPMEGLREAAGKEADEINKVLALRGYVRMIGMLSDRPATERAGLYGQALSLATRQDERKMILNELSSVADPEALKLAEARLHDSDLTAEAMAAYGKIATALVKSHPDVAKGALQKVIDTASDDNLKKVAREALAALDKK